MPQKDALLQKSDFQQAHEILRSSRSTKLNKRDERVEYSYLHKPDLEPHKGCTYQLTGVKLAGINGESRSVKCVKDANGIEHAVKVAAYAYPVNVDQIVEIKVLKKLDRLQNVILRELPPDKQYDFYIDYDPQNTRSVRITHQLYIIQNKIPGITLDAWLNEKKQSNSAKRQVSFAICKALANLHRHGIIHGDVKPDNIMIFVNNGIVEAEFIDFGNSKMIEKGQTEVLASKFAGTPAYSAPECSSQRQDGKYAYSQASDIYSLGKLMSRDLGVRFTENLEDQLVSEDSTQRASLNELAGALLENLYLTRSEGGVHPLNTYALASLYKDECLNFEKLRKYIRSDHPSMFIQALSCPDKKTIKQLETSYKFKSDNFHIGPLFKSESIVSKLIKDWSKEKNMEALVDSIRAVYQNNKIGKNERRFAQDFLSALHCIQGEYVLNRDVQEAKPKLAFK